jgi:hypothetical protein
MMPRLFRALALVIALAGVLDPAVTSTRRGRSSVAVVAAHPVTDAALIARVADELADAFTVVPAAFAAAAGTVIVGMGLPPSAEELAMPVLAVTPVGNDIPALTIEGVDAPVSAALDGRVPIVVSTRAARAAGQTLEVSLRAGELVIDRATHAVSRADERADLHLTFIPGSIGAAPLRIIAGVSGSRDSAGADVVIDVRAERWAVLFFDPRPSWMSTFVRRAIEGDRRFLVTSRVVTSRNISTDAGRPPGTLDDLRVLGEFSTVVVGAPEALGDRDVAGLDAYLRRRGGTVVLLLDQRADGAYRRLTNVREWSGAASSARFVVGSANIDSASLQASEVAWPRALPPGARPLAVAAASDQPAVRHPVIWRSAVGAGSLVVSGALDAWRFRDPAVSGFDTFWRTLIAEAATRAPPPAAIEIARSVMAPGEQGRLGVTVRDAALTDLSAVPSARATISATLSGQGQDSTLTLWPEGPVGEFHGSFRAPAAPGVYRISVTGDGTRADAPVAVVPNAGRATPDLTGLAEAFASSRGGVSIASDRLPELVPTLQRLLQAVPRPETWYPMRSGWWIVPFCLALGAEWLWRRRRGLA